MLFLEHFKNYYNSYYSRREASAAVMYWFPVENSPDTKVGEETASYLDRPKLHPKHKACSQGEVWL